MGGAKMAVVFAGTNDSKSRPPVEVAAELLRQTVVWFNRVGVPVILVLPPPVDPFLMPAFSGGSNRWLRDFSHRVQSIAMDGKLSVRAVVDLCQMEPSYTLIDGVHFNPHGHRLVAELIVKAMRDLSPHGPVYRQIHFIAEEGQLYAVRPD